MHDLFEVIFRLLNGLPADPKSQIYTATEGGRCRESWRRWLGGGCMLRQTPYRPVAFISLTANRRKQYKSKITAWCLDKNLKRSEVTAMLHEKRRREALGQTCIFISRGWIVDVASLERSSKRAKLSLATSSHETAQLPPDICCITIPSTSSTAPPTTLRAPSAHETLRALFHHTSVLFHSFFDRDVHTAPTRRDYSSLDAALATMTAALGALRSHDFKRAGSLLDRSFAALDAIVTSNHPNALSIVLKTVGACYRAGFSEVAAEGTAPPPERDFYIRLPKY